MDKLMAKLALASTLALSMGGNAMAETLNFDNAAAGTSPDGWTLTMTGKGQPKWTVEAESTAPSQPNVLKQSGRATFPLAIKRDTSIRDGFVEVKFKAVAGSEDRAAGVIWRAKDADNYYVVRANALEDNVVLYKRSMAFECRLRSWVAKAAMASAHRCHPGNGTCCAATLREAGSR